jgi:hypothetical protein
MYLLAADLAADSQLLVLGSQGITSIRNRFGLPSLLAITRGSDGAVEFVLLVIDLSGTTGTIVRAQQNSTALAFVTGDTADYVPVPVTKGLLQQYAGSPALGVTNAIHPSFALTNATQNITTSFVAPDYPRSFSFTGNQAGIVGNVVVTAPNVLGVSISETVALNGATTVYTTKAFGGKPTNLLVPAETHPGADSLVMGTGPRLALGFPITRDLLFRAHRANPWAKDATATCRFGDDVSDCTVEMTAALNGDRILFDLFND